MKLIPSFETSRIKARKITPGDLDDLASMYQMPEVMKTMGGVRTRQNTLDRLAGHLAHWDEHGFGLYILEDKNSGSFMGRGGLQHVTIDGRGEIEVIYAFLPEYWGKGLATELVYELIQIAFEDLDCDELIGFTLPENDASKRVLEKSGFSYQKRSMHSDLPHDLYRLVKAMD